MEGGDVFVRDKLHGKKKGGAGKGGKNGKPDSMKKGKKGENSTDESKKEKVKILRGFTWYGSKRR